MSALTSCEGLIERFETLPWLRAVIIGEPTAIHVCPAIYIILIDLGQPLQNTAQPSRSTMNATTYSYLVRLVLLWQDNPEAERELMAYVDDPIAAVVADPRLGGRLYSGIASMSRGVAGYLNQGGNVYRVFDYTATVAEKS